MNRTTDMLKMVVAAAAAAAALSNAAVAQDEEEQYLVVAANNDFPDSRVQEVEQAGGQVVKVFPQIGVAVATSAEPEFPARAKGVAGVKSVVPDPIAVPVADAESVLAESVPGVTPGVDKTADMTGLQWGLQAIQAPAAWELGVTGKGVRVAVIDTGIMTTHPDLVQNLNLELSKSLVSGETIEFIPERTKFSHATHVAGIIAAADDGVGITGVAPDAELVAIKVLSDRIRMTRVSWWVEAILYAAEIDADVANLSLVFYWMKFDLDWWEPTDVAYSVAVRAVRFAQQQGTLVVAAAGNGGRNFDGAGYWVDFPRDMPGVIGVAATAPLDLWAYDPGVYLDWPAPYTDYGQRVIDLAAPGGWVDLSDVSPEALAILTKEGITYPARAFNMVVSTSTSFGRDEVYDEEGTWDYRYGTSSAAPHVAGVAALVIEANGGDLTPAQIRTILQQSADDLGKPGNDDYYGAGRVNALRAVLAK